MLWPECWPTNQTQISCDRGTQLVSVEFSRGLLQLFAAVLAMAMVIEEAIIKAADKLGYAELRPAATCSLHQYLWHEIDEVAHVCTRIENAQIYGYVTVYSALAYRYCWRTF